MRRPPEALGVALLAAGAAAFGLSGTAPAPAGATPAAVAAAAPAALCNGPALAGVYHPQRLEVVQACAYATGVIARRRVEADGDVHLYLAPDPAFAGMVNGDNPHGDLVVEIVPADQGAVAVPRLGEHVLAAGPYVYDKSHGWLEIHPARYVVRIRDWSAECTPPSGAAARTGRC